MPDPVNDHHVINRTLQSEINTALQGSALSYNLDTRPVNRVYLPADRSAAGQLGASYHQGPHGHSPSTSGYSDAVARRVRQIIIDYGSNPNVLIQKLDEFAANVRAKLLTGQLTLFGPNDGVTRDRILADATAAARLRREELTIAQDRNARTVLTAPAAGTVQQLQVHTLGAVVRPADPLLVIVPDGSTLVVDAMVLNRDIGFVREGQSVRVKLEAFPFTRYGVVDGTLALISRDAVQDENLGLVFPARVELSQYALSVDGRTTPISAGMSVTAEIKTGRRRVIEFLLSPLQRRVEEAGRER